MNWRLAGVLLIPLALLLGAEPVRAALAQAWPPFVLVAGLLAIGLVAGRDGLFDAAASRLVCLPGAPMMLALACFALVAIVTALLNLDTAAVFLTPVLVKTAQRRGLDTGCFLYGAIFMTNASSLFLPGSNLTNLLVLSGGHISGGTFFTRMLPVAVAAPAITAAGLLVIHRRGLFAGNGSADETSAESTDTPTRARLGLGLWGAVVAAALIVALHNAALPVLAIGLILLAVRTHGGELSWRENLLWLDLPTLAGLFGLVVALGTLARECLPGRRTALSRTSGNDSDSGVEQRGDQQPAGGGAALLNGSSADARAAAGSERRAQSRRHGFTGGGAVVALGACGGSETVRAGLLASGPGAGAAGAAGRARTERCLTRAP